MKTRQLQQSGKAPTDRSAESHDSFRTRRTFGSLDGIRALSILSVLWHHSKPVTLPWHLHTRGFLGVDMFFVLSGFLIVTLLLRERERNAGISLRDFYLRRSLRIFPLYYAVLAAVAAVCLLRPAGETARLFWTDWPYLVTYTSNWHHAGGLLAVTWSLSAEEQFYLVWPSLEKLGRRFAWVCLALLLVGSQLVSLHVLDGWLASHLGWPANEPTMLRETTFIPILLGVVLAHVLHTPRGFAWVFRALGARWASPCTALCLLVLLALAPTDLGPTRQLVQLGMMCFLAACVVNEQHGLSRLLRTPALVRLGVLSYGIYLLHMFVVAFAEPALARLHADLGHGLPLFAATLIGTYLVAELSFRYYEQVFLRLKDRFRRE